MNKQHDWLKEAVGNGLMALVVLHLDGGPGAETVGKTAAIWYRVMKSWPIAWDEALDRQRLTDAFLVLAGQSQRWPSPTQLRALLPARQYPQPALSAPDYPAEKAKENRKKLKQMIGSAFTVQELSTQLSTLKRRHQASKDDALLEDIEKLEQQIKEERKSYEHS
jgi:hypothetical protein